jgi:hypothetical protein
MKKAQTTWDVIKIDMCGKRFTLSGLKEAISAWSAGIPAGAKEISFEFKVEEEYGYDSPKLCISYVREMTPIEIGRIRKKEDKIKELEIAELERIKAKYGLYN